MDMNSCVEANNGTESNNTSNRPASVLCGTSTLTNVIVFLIGCLVFLSDACTCVAMVHTRRVPFPTRLLTSVTLLCNCVFMAMFMLTVLPAEGEVDFYPQLRCIGTEIGRLCIATSWVAMALMSLERVLCLNWGIYYSRYVTKDRTWKLVTGVLGIINLLKLLIRFIVVPLYRRQDLNFLHACGDLQINVYILTVCLLISIPCYVNIYVIIQRHMKNMKFNLVEGLTTYEALNKSYKSTRAVSALFVIFIVLHLPVLITLISFHFMDTKYDLGRFLVFISVVLMCGTNPVLYAWRFKECRFIMKSFINRKFGLYEKSVERMRIDIYNIVVSDKRRQNTSLQDSKTNTSFSLED